MLFRDDAAHSSPTESHSHPYQTKIFRLTNFCMCLGRTARCKILELDNNYINKTNFKCRLLTIISLSKSS